MSRARGEKILVETESKSSLDLGFRPGIKWNRTKKVFIVLVPDMYDVMRRGIKENIMSEPVEIKEEDFYRLINADRGVKYGFWFNFEDEKLDLDDDTYLGISYVQYAYYLSVTVLKEAKRVSKRCGYPQWVFLKKRVKRGGRPVGGGKTKRFCDLSSDEQERIYYLRDNYEKIVDNMCKHDWVYEYVELQRDMCLYEGKKFPGTKKTIADFAEIRRVWLEKNG